MSEIRNDIDGSAAIILASGIAVRLPGINPVRDTYLRNAIETESECQWVEADSLVARKAL